MPFQVRSGSFSHPYPLQAAEVPLNLCCGLTSFFMKVPVRFKETGMPRRVNSSLAGQPFLLPLFTLRVRFGRRG